MKALTARWNDRLDQAGTDPTALTALLRELVMARVRSLTDMVAQRQATWAVVLVHDRLGDATKALHAAREWLQLADSAPVASDDEVAAARAWMTAAGAEAPARQRLPRAAAGGPSSRKRREPRERRPPADPLDLAREAGLAGQWSEAFKQARRRRGPEADAIRVWLHVAKALSLEGEAREAQLRDTEAWLRKRARVPAAEGAAPAPAPPPEGDAVAAIVGRALPGKRAAAVRFVEGFIAHNADKADALGAALLRAHVDTHGPKKTAPWWFTAIAHVLAVTDGEATRAAIAELGDAYAVTAYREAAFEQVVAATRAILGAGHRLTSVRRGASREEPADRRVWTVRFSPSDRVERQLAVAPDADGDWPEGAPAQIAERLVHLCPTTVLYANGAGNLALSQACGAIGVSTLSGASPEVAVAALAGMAPVQPAPAPPKAAPKAAPRSTPDDAAPAAAAAPTPPKVSAIDTLASLLAADDLDEAAVADAMRAVRRRRTVQRMVEERSPTYDDAFVAAIARIATVAWPGERPLPEFTTLLVRAAVRGGAACHALLTEGELADRLGGDGLAFLLDVTRPAVDDGWTVDRVLRGATRREREDSPLVDTASDALRSLWRAVLVRGEARGELWGLGDLAPEARAALPQLMLAERQRTIVVPVDGEVLGWYGDLGGPEAVGWTGPDAAEAVTSAVAGWAS